MRQEMNKSFSNLKIQKKYLSNINSLLQFKSYQNPGMERNKLKVEELIKAIKNERFKVNDYMIIDELVNLLYDLGICDIERMVDYNVDHEWLMKNYTPEAIGPYTQGCSSGNDTIIYHNDLGQVTSTRPFDFEGGESPF